MDHRRKNVAIPRAVTLRSDAVLLAVIGKIFNVKLLGLALSVGLQLLMARYMGAAEYGLFAYAWVYVAIAIWLCKLGWVQTLVKYVAIYNGRSQWSLLRGLLRTAYRYVLAAALTLLALAGAMAVMGLAISEKSPSWMLLLIAAHVPFVALADLRLGVLRGLNVFVYAELPENLVRPLALAAWLGMLWLAGDAPVGAQGMLAGSVLVAGMNAALGSWWMHKHLPAGLEDTTPDYDKAEWQAMALPMFVLGGCQMWTGQMDLWLVGTLLGPERAGVYAISARIAEFATFGALVTSGVVAPLAADCWHAGDVPKLRRLVNKAARVNAVIAGAVILVAVLWGRAILSLFGIDFAEGYLPLVLLVIGKGVVAVAGAAVAVLLMAGGQRWVMGVMALSLALGLALNFGLIGKYGMAGAAAATSIMLALCNVVLWACYQHRLAHPPKN